MEIAIKDEYDFEIGYLPEGYNVAFLLVKDDKEDSRKDVWRVAFFKETYPEKVIVYSIGDISKELCQGPHVKGTAEIGRVRIKKQKKIGSNLIRIYAVAE